MRKCGFTDSESPVTSLVKNTDLFLTPWTHLAYICKWRKPLMALFGRQWYEAWMGNSFQGITYESYLCF